MASEPEEEPAVGWAVQMSPDQIRQSQERTAKVKKWLTPKHLLVAVLVIWNAGFLSAFVYTFQNHDPSRSVVLGVVFWLWILGDIAILLCACSARLIRRARRGVA
jgi:hypothetical protein